MLAVINSVKTYF